MSFAPPLFMKYFIPILLLLFFCGQVCSQNFNNRTRYNLEAALHIELITSDSVFYISTVLADTLPPYKASLGFMKYNYNGDLISGFSKGDTISKREFFDVNPEILFGDIYLNGSIELPNISTTTPCLLKTNFTGEILWEKYYPYFEEVDYFQNKAMTFHNNKFYLANRLRKSGQAENMSIQIIDTTGNLLYNKFIPTQDWGRVASISSWGDILVLGGIRTIGVPENIGHRSKSLLVGIDSIGNKLWEWVYNGSELSNGVSNIVVADNGNLVISHAVGDEVIINSSSSVIHSSKYLVTELNQNLDIVWQCVMDPTDLVTGYEFFSTLHKCEDNSGYLASGPIYVEGPNQLGEVLGYIGKISLTGDSLWTRKVLHYETEEELELRSPYFHTVYDIAETPDGSILIAGEAWESDIYPQQAWVAKVDEYGCHVPGCHLIDAINEQNISNFHLSVYPNPTTESINVYLPDFEVKNKSEFLLFDLSGKLLKSYSCNYGNTNYVLPVGSFSPGQYYLSWRLDGEIVGSEVILIGEEQ